MGRDEAQVPGDAQEPDEASVEQTATGLGSGQGSGLGHSNTSEPEPLLDEAGED